MALHQYSLFSELPDAQPMQRQKQLTIPHPKQVQKKPEPPLTTTQRQELKYLRERNRVLTEQLASLEERHDAAWCLFHRRLDAMPDDGRGARTFAARFLVDVIREAHSRNTATHERELAVRWLSGDDVGGIVSVQEICAFAGVEHSRMAKDMGQSLISNTPRPRVRQL